MHKDFPELFENQIYSVLTLHLCCVAFPKMGKNDDGKKNTRKINFFFFLEVVHRIYSGNADPQAILDPVREHTVCAY